MNPKEFDRLRAQGHRRLPLLRKVPADFETPLSVYAKLAAEPYSFLFESLQGGEKWGRYSFIGLPARSRLVVRGDTVERVHEEAVVERRQGVDPLAWIAGVLAEQRAAPVPGLPRFSGGLVGYFGHDTVRYIEPRLAGVHKPDPLGVPDILLMVCDELAVFDNVEGTLQLIVHADAADPDAVTHARARLDALEARLAAPAPPAAAPVVAPVDEADFAFEFPREAFLEAVERAKRYIVDGDIMQVVLSQRSVAPFAAPPLSLYRALRILNPSPYMYYLDLGGFHVVGSSPEILARLEDGEVTVRPIAGTRRRGRDPEEDRALEAELVADPKERAEHLMLIDLGRNDVGRVAERGSVRVTETMVVERYSHVMHMVSNVVGRLRPGLDALDVLRATFPAGTLSGAPKIRALEIIDELEPVKRGVYGGAIGYLGWDGAMDTAIAIRTALIKDGRLYMQAGAGVVHDSRPELEWKETLNKSRAIYRAARLAAAGLRLDDAAG